MSSADSPSLPGVFILGDSLTRYGRVQAHGFVSLLKGKLSEKFSIFSYGVSGHKITDILIDFPASLTGDDEKPENTDSGMELREEARKTAEKINVLFILIGINDVWHKYRHGTGTDALKFERYYRKLLVRAKSLGIPRICIMTPPLIGEKKIGENEADERLEEFIVILKKLSEEQHCDLLDTRKAFHEALAIENPENLFSGIFTLDGVHFNERGNLFLAELIQQKINEIIL